MMTGAEQAGRGPHRAAQQGRKAALVIAATGLLWMVVQVVGGLAEWPVAVMLAGDVAAVAAFFWGFVVTYRLWRARRGKKD